jgi:hypothetical protein
LTIVAAVVHDLQYAAKLVRPSVGRCATRQLAESETTTTTTTTNDSSTQLAQSNDTYIGLMHKKMLLSQENVTVERRFSNRKLGIEISACGCIARSGQLEVSQLKQAKQHFQESFQLNKAFNRHAQHTIPRNTRLSTQ